MDRTEAGDGGLRGGGLEAGGLIRRARRLADLSQRELAERMGVSRASIGRLETDTGALAVTMLERILAIAGLRLAVLDAAGLEVTGMRADAERDNAARRYPAHLDAAPPTFEQRAILPLQRHRPAPRLAYRWRRGRDLRRHDADETAGDHPTPEDVRAARPHPPIRPWRPADPATVCWCDAVCERYCVDTCTCQCEVDPAL